MLDGILARVTTATTNRHSGTQGMGGNRARAARGRADRRRAQGRPARGRPPFRPPGEPLLALTDGRAPKARVAEAGLRALGRAGRCVAGRPADHAERLGRRGRCRHHHRTGAHRRARLEAHLDREYVESRFNWKKRDPLWVLVLRVHRLARTGDRARGTTTTAAARRGSTTKASPTPRASRPRSCSRMSRSKPSSRVCARRCRPGVGLQAADSHSPKGAGLGFVGAHSSGVESVSMSPSRFAAKAAGARMAELAKTTAALTTRKQQLSPWLGLPSRWSPPYARQRTVHCAADRESGTVDPGRSTS